MTDDERPKKKWRRLIRIAGSLISLVVLSYFAISLISGKGLGLSWLSDRFSKRDSVEMADEYYFDVGRDRVFANLGDSLAAVGSLGIQVIDAGGGETLRDPFRMSNPAVTALNGRAIAFDIGGTAVRVFNKSDIVASVETNSAVISSSINRNGWFSVCAQESGGFKGSVTVYNNTGSEVYKIKMASGYILSAELSPDNKSIAVLDMTEGGSRITFYNLSSETAENSFSLPDGLIIDIRYLSGGDLLAVSTESLIIIDKHGAGKQLYVFSGKQLNGYVIYSDFIALHLLDYGVGYQGRVVTLSESGNLLGELITDREIISMSAGGGYLTILRSDGLRSYNSRLEEFPLTGKSGSTIGATSVLALDNGAVIVAGDHSAVMFRLVEV